MPINAHQGSELAVRAKLFTPDCGVFGPWGPAGVWLLVWWQPAIILGHEVRGLVLRLCLCTAASCHPTKKPCPCSQDLPFPEGRGADSSVFCGLLDPGGAPSRPARIPHALCVQFGLEFWL